MSAGTEYANKLELWFQSTPGVVQQVVRPIFDPANDMLKSVAGDPADLVRAGQRYIAISRDLINVAEEQRAHRRILVGAWEGEGYEAFTARAEDIEQKLAAVGEVTGSTKDVLEAAAEACVQGANLIIDIVVNLIAFAIGTLIIKAALAVFTFGASLAAGAAVVLARGAVALAQILRVLSRVAAALQKVAQILRNLAEVLRKLATIFREVRLLLKELDALKKAAKATHGAFSKAHAVAAGVRGAGYALTNNILLGGAVPRPGGSLIETGKDLKGAVDAVRDVDDAAHR